MLRTLLVDDEALARTRLRKQLKPLIKDERITIVGEALDGVEALELLASTPVDLLFLDVQMPGLDGFEVLERLDPEQRPVVVFITAYDAYAVQAFEANAIDYLLKPVSRERLQESVHRAETVVRQPEEQALTEDRLNRLLNWLDRQALDDEPPEPVDEPLRQLSIPYRDRILVVPVDRIVAIEVNEGLTRIVLLDENPDGARKISQYVVSYTLEQLESRLDPEVFMRVHRSTIIALPHIREMITWFSGRFKIRLTGGYEVIASRERSKLLKKRLTL